MRNSIAAILFAAAMLTMQSAAAEDKAAGVTDMEALRAAVKTDKKAFVASTLKLTDAEAKRFWPIYDAYQRDLDAANRKRAVAITGLVGQDRPVSDLYARNLANELLAADEAQDKLTRALQNRLMRGVPTRVLPQRKAARYLQLESKIRAAQAYDIAATIPLIQ